MSLKAFLTNVGDFIEGLAKKIGIGDSDAKEAGDAVAAVLGSFLAKWNDDAMHALLAAAKKYAPGVIADPSTIVNAAELLFAEVSDQLKTITISDAKDALRTHLIASTGG